MGQLSSCISHSTTTIIADFNHHNDYNRYCHQNGSLFSIHYSARTQFFPLTPCLITDALISQDRDALVRDCKNVLQHEEAVMWPPRSILLISNNLLLLLLCEVITLKYSIFTVDWPPKPIFNAAIQFYRSIYHIFQTRNLYY